jgi:hypothetical protein
VELKGDIGRDGEGDNFRIHLTEIGWESVGLIRMGSDRIQRHALENTVMKLRLP